MTQKEWLDTTISDYNKRKKQTLRELLDSTTMIAKQYLDDPDSKATKEILKTCIECNNKFLNKITLK